jgi:hypothetical protein
VQASIEEANRLYREGLALAKATDDRWAIGHALLFLGWNARRTGNYREAAHQLEEALAQFEQTGDAGGIVTSRAALSELAIYQGRYEDALIFGRESRSMADGFNPMPGLMGSSTMAQALYALGEYEEAEALLREGLRVYQAYGREDCEDWLFGLGQIAFAGRDYARAAQLFKDSLATAVQFGNLHMVIQNQISQGRLYLAQGSAIEARRQLLAALQSVVLSEWRPLLLDCVATIAVLFVEERDLESALLLATLVAENPASRAMSKEGAERLLARHQIELSSDQMAAVRQRSRVSDLETVAAELLSEFETA